MKNRTIELTRGEEEIMQILWALGNATVREIIPLTREPHPKYTTVATFLKILEQKGFAAHRPEGKSHRFYPLISNKEYARSVTLTLLDNYFGGSPARLMSFLLQGEDISAGEVEQILRIVGQARKQPSCTESVASPSRVG